MEVCGRYHHWMPLLVRVVHKDVFILWCLTYLRLLTGNTLTGTYAFSVESSKQVWAVASAAAANETSNDVKLALLASAFRL
jgi:heme/copper-type cytochrome/quinol oxidase subunit 2